MKQNPLLEKLDKTPLEESLEKCKIAFWVVFGFAFCINLLMLLTPLYALQVLDRVIGSGNMTTLLMLSIVIGFIYFIHGLLQITRSFTLIKVGEWLDREMSPKIFAQSISNAARTRSNGLGQILRDFQGLKSFLTSMGINTIFDMPWTVVYIAVIFMLHPYIGFLTVVGGVVIITLALFNAIATNKKLGEATEYSIKGLSQAEIAGRNAEVIEAMGMIRNVSNNWHKFNKMSLSSQSVASYRNGVISNLSRFIRNLIQMSVTGIGAYIVVSTGGRDMTTGGMIASSILVGRALAPFDNFIELWKSINNTMKSYKRIQLSFNTGTPNRDDAMPLPNISGYIVAENISYALAAPQQSKDIATLPRFILKGVSFAIDPGEILAVIGHTAAGKSSLAKILVGVWKSSGGKVTIDGGEVYNWNREDFGRHVGYLPQDIELFGGSVKENIARMSEEVDPEKVVEAAKMAGAHEMILGLSQSYDTDIGAGGSNLSGGQKQRLGLARAFFGNPKFVVLDEPNANLDEAGEKALSEALKTAKNKKISVVVISHRPSVLSIVDKLLILDKGQVAEYGYKSEVIKHITTKDSGTMHIE